MNEELLKKNKELIAQVCDLIDERDAIKTKLDKLTIEKNDFYRWWGDEETKNKDLNSQIARLNDEIAVEKAKVKDLSHDNEKLIMREKYYHMRAVSWKEQAMEAMETVVELKIELSTCEGFDAI